MGSLPAWRDASLILLCLEAFVICLPIVIVGIYVVRYFGRFLGWLKRSFPTWQRQLVSVRNHVEDYSGRIVAPIMVVAAAFTALSTFVSVLTTMPSRNWRSGRG